MTENTCRKYIYFIMFLKQADKMYIAERLDTGSGNVAGQMLWGKLGYRVEFKMLIAQQIPIFICSTYSYGLQVVLNL